MGVRLAIESTPMVRANACPDINEMRDFSCGRLNSDRVESFSLHIEKCENCQQVLESFDSCPVPLEKDLRVLSTESTVVHEGALSSKLSLGSFSGSVPSDLVQLARMAIDTDRFQLWENGSTEAELDNKVFDSGKRYAMALRSGPVSLGKFQLIKEIGAGEFGFVFKAIDTDLKREVAIKILRAGSFATEKEVERFFQEARSIASLHHPGIVSLYDCVKSESGDCYLVAQLIDGESLEKVLKSETKSQHEPFFSDRVQFAVRCTEQIANSLHYAHKHGVVHRDVKPSNVLLDKNGHCHLTDFGLAKLEVDATLTTEGQVMGTPAYMSPEQAAGNSHLVDGRSDQFSLGVIFYQLLTGQRPFQGDRRMVMLQVLEFDPPHVRKLVPTIPRDLETICHKTLEKNPAKRYRTAEEFADDLRRFQAGVPIHARRAGVIESSIHWCRKYPLISTLLVSAPLSLLVGFLYLMNLTSLLVKQSALGSVEVEADMLETINNYYSEEVVGRLDWKKTKVTHHYTSIDQSLPLPFTFMIDAAQRITDQKNGMKVRIYSAYPWRSDGGPNGDFQANALKKLEERLDNNSETDKPPSFHQFQSDRFGDRLLYARAQIMKESCVKCHNEHVDSPKRDWVEGDLAGVLAITRPLKEDTKNVQEGLKSAFYVVVGTSFLLVCFSMLGLWGIKSRANRQANLTESRIQS